MKQVHVCKMVVLILVLILSIKTGYTQNWQRASTAQPAWIHRILHKCITFNNKMWFFNGLAASKGVPKPDIYSSEDGVTWDLVINPVPYGARTGFTPLVFNDQLWIIGGRECPT